MDQIKGCIFDLDGVIVDTAKYHFRAWQSICDELDIPFTAEDNEKLKGISRVKSLEMLLSLGNKELDADQKVKYLSKKNKRYLSFIEKMDEKEILPGVENLMKELKQNGIKLGLGSASKNARKILSVLNLDNYFDVIVDGTDVTKSKPDPEIFIKGAQQLNVAPHQCIVFEDSIAGIEAAANGGFISVGIGDGDILANADINIEGFSNFTYTELLQNLPIRS